MRICTVNKFLLNCICLSVKKKNKKSKESSLLTNVDEQQQNKSKFKARLWWFRTNTIQIILYYIQSIIMNLIISRGAGGLPWEHLYADG